MLILILKRILAGVVFLFLLGIVAAAVEAVAQWFTRMCDEHPRLRTIMDNLVFATCFLAVAYMIGWLCTLCI